MSDRQGGEPSQQKLAGDQAYQTAHPCPVCGEDGIMNLPHHLRHYCEETR